MDKKPLPSSESKAKVIFSFNLIFSQFLKQMKEFSSVLNGSSDYWSSTITNLGKNFCSCTRPEEFIEQDIDNKELDAGKKQVESIENIQSVRGNTNINSLTTKDTQEIQVELNFDKINYENEEQNKNEENRSSLQTITDKNNETENYENSPIKKSTNNAYNFVNNLYNLSYEEANNDFINNKRSWTEEEDQLLLHLVATSNSRNWKKISNILKNKSPQQCSYRYNKLIISEKRKWTRNEDIMLLDLYESIGANWIEISFRLPGRTPEDIQERFEDKLNPCLKRSKFDKEEDEKILLLHEKHGNQWNEISKYFRNRNAAMIKNRFYSFLKKKVPATGQKFSPCTDYNRTAQISLTLSESDSFSISGNSSNQNIHNTSSLLATQYKKQKGVPAKNKSKKTKNIISCQIIERESEGSSKERSEKNSREENSNSNPSLDGRKNLTYFDSNLPKEKTMKKYEDNETYDNMEHIESEISNENTINRAFHNMKFEEDSIILGLEHDRNENEVFKNIMTSKLASIDSSPSVSSYIRSINNLSEKNSNYLPEKPQENYSQFSSKYGNDMIIDDTEANYIPRDLLKLDPDSPKNKFLCNEAIDEMNNNFNEHYRNAFKTKKNSFDDKAIDELEQSLKLSSYNSSQGQSCTPSATPSYSLSSYSLPSANYDVKDIDGLKKQYQMLESVYDKVQEVKLHHNKIYYSVKNTDVKTVTLNKKLDEKSDNLSQKLQIVKMDYFNQININKDVYNCQAPNADQTLISQNKVRESLISQIEILMELIKTTKLKISLMSKSGPDEHSTNHDDKMVEG